MGSRTIPIFTLAALLAGISSAQDIAGTWQGTLKSGAKDLRTIVDISKDENGWKAFIFSIDQYTEWLPVSSVMLEGSTFKLTSDAIGVKYEGEVSADGASITGTWIQGKAMQLELRRATKETAWQRDPTQHMVQFVTVDKGVKLEVLDWGGSGRPLVFLSGLGNTAHIFDNFAPNLTSSYHVYGITRRGFGASSVPATGYSADRLGDDVLAVIDFLKLNRPVLAGHSIAGEELSSIGSRYPNRIAGLVYLDAAYAYAFYNPSVLTLDIDLIELRKKLDRLRSGNGSRDEEQLVQDLLTTSLPRLELELKDYQEDLKTFTAAGLGSQPTTPPPAPVRAISLGEQKYTDIPVPVLAIFADPHNQRGTDPKAREALEARDLVETEAQARAFETGVPTARVVRLAHANHFVFISNEADVLREINAFMANLR